MKTLKVLLQEVVSGIKAWVNSNFAQESNTVHKTGNETVNGVKTFTGNVVQNQAGGTNVYCATCDGVVKGDLTSSGMLSIVCKDGSNANMETSGLAAVYMGQDTSGSYVSLRADTSYNNTRYNASVSLDIDPTTANNNAIFRPRRDNTIDLGSSSYQFKNLYANNYYYKGTAWGLDKSNVWSNFNRFNGYRLEIKHTSQEIGVIPASNQWNGVQFTDKNNYPTITFEHAFMGSGETRFKINMIDNSASQESDSTVWIEFLRFTAYSGGSAFVIGADARPMINNAYELGTSTNKWKTLNGINPGALSFPNYSDTTYIDISGSIVPPAGETKINKNLESNYYTPPVDGWLSIRCDGAQYLQIYRNTYNCPGVTAGDGTASIKLVVTLPVRKNETYTIRIKKEGAGIENYQLYPCLGNV